MSALKKYTKKIDDQWFLLTELVRKGIRLKYRQSYLGIMWSMIEPLLTTIVLVVVFSTLLSKKIENFPLYIISGRLIYSYFSGATRTSGNSIWKNKGMIKKVYVPKYLYPISECIFQFIIFSISLIIVVLMMIYCQVPPTVYIWQVIPSLILLFGLAVGCGLILATINVFFRDMQYLWNVMLTIIMYLSAIFYDPSSILEGKWAFIIKLNPLFCIIHIFRGGVQGFMAWRWDYCYATLFVAMILCIGIYMFRKNQDEFVFYV